MVSFFFEPHPPEHQRTNAAGPERRKLQPNKSDTTLRTGTTIVPVSTESGYSDMRNHLLRFAPPPFDIAFKQLQRVGVGGQNEVRAMPASVGAYVVRRTVKPTPFNVLLAEAWISRRFAALGVSPRVEAMWLERSDDANKTGRLFIVMPAYERSLRSLLEQRSLTAKEESTLVSHLRAVALSGMMLLDLKLLNILHKVGDDGSSMLSLIDFDAYWTVKAPRLSPESRELIQLLQLVGPCSKPSLLRARLSELVNESTVASRVEREQRQCDSTEQRLWRRKNRFFKHCQLMVWDIAQYLKDK